MLKICYAVVAVTFLLLAGHGIADEPKKADGHSWEVKIEYGKKKVHSIGANMFPEHFERYEKAVLALRSEKQK